MDFRIFPFTLERRNRNCSIDRENVMEKDILLTTCEMLPFMRHTVSILETALIRCYLCITCKV